MLTINAHRHFEMSTISRFQPCLKHSFFCIFICYLYKTMKTRCGNKNILNCLRCLQCACNQNRKERDLMLAEADFLIYYTFLSLLINVFLSSFIFLVLFVFLFSLLYLSVSHDFVAAVLVLAFQFCHFIVF